MVVWIEVRVRSNLMAVYLNNVSDLLIPTNGTWLSGSR